MIYMVVANSQFAHLLPTLKDADHCPALTFQCFKEKFVTSEIPVE